MNGAEGFGTCRECILAEAEERHKCPLCRTGIAADSLREGVLPGDEEVAGQAGAHSQQLTLFESKLNVLLKEVPPRQHSLPCHDAQTLGKSLLSSQMHHSHLDAC